MWHLSMCFAIFIIVIILQLLNIRVEKLQPIFAMDRRNRKYYTSEMLPTLPETITVLVQC